MCFFFPFSSAICDLVRLLYSTRSALPTVDNQASQLQLSNSSKQMDNAIKELKTCIDKAFQVCGSLEIEASADLIDSLQQEIEEFRSAANSFSLQPLPGESLQSATLLLNTASKSVGSTVSQLIIAASQGNEDITNRAARDTSNALRDYTSAVRGVAAATKDRNSQNRILDQANLVMNKSARLVIEAQRAMQNPSDPSKNDRLQIAGKDVNLALNGAISCLPGQEEVEETMTHISSWSKQIESGQFPRSGRPYGELQNQLTHAADKLNNATSDVVQAAPRPERLAESSKQFGEVLGEMMECSMDMAGQTNVSETRTNMVSTMRSVTSSSTTFLSSAKTVAADPSAPNAKNNLASAARYMHTINNRQAFKKKIS